MACSIVTSSCTGASDIVTPIDAAAASISRFKSGKKPVSGLKITATRVTPGATSLSNWSHFPMIGVS
jgi:hypothetical protein